MPKSFNDGGGGGEGMSNIYEFLIKLMKLKTQTFLILNQC